MGTKSSTTGWGFYEQGSDQMLEVMELGEKLNIAIECPVHFPAFGKNLYECQCNIIFPTYVVKGSSVETLRNIHKGRQKQ